MEKNFTAIDFETFTPAYTSACSVGIVKVINGFISRKYYTLIKPIPDDKSTFNTMIHGITAEMIEDAPTFNKIFPFMKAFIGDDYLVCHNANTDMRVLQDCMDYYNLSGIDTKKYIDTYDLFGESLVDCCKHLGVQINNHHDSLCDAEACALCYLRGNGHVSAGITSLNLKDVMNEKEHKKYNRSTLDPLSDNEIINKDTIFYHAKVVITGVFNNYPEREELGEILKGLGADIDTTVTKKTNIVVVGKGAGPAKMKKIENFNENGCDIKVIYEEELITLLNK